MEFGYKNLAFILIFLASISFLYFNLIRIYHIIKLGKKEERKTTIWQDTIRMLKIAIGQTKIFRDDNAGWLHAAIFWGFLVFLFSAAESVFQGFYPGFSWNFLGYFYSLLSLLTDVIALFIIAAIIYALYRRFIIKVPRLQGDGNEKLDAILVLGFIFVITTSLLIQNASHIVVFGKEEYAIKPVSEFISSIISFGFAPTLYDYSWWVHILAIFVFMNYLPYSKHFHVYTSIPTVYVGSDNIPNKLSKIDFEDESNEKYGATEFTDLSWRTIMDGYSCTHCGRCTSVCPANLTGKVLDPREVIVQTRNRADELGKILIRQNGNDPLIDPAKLTESELSIESKKFIGDYENPEALWQCTTCGACMMECPITIEHVPAIIEMRRGLVMMESEFPNLLQTTFANLENSGNPWGFSPADRANWTEGLNVKTAAEVDDFEYLFWVGCAGSFDEKGIKVSKVLSHLLNEAEIKFAILGTEEQCNGDPARRAGNEYLADMLIKMNVETLTNYKVKKVITTCPHCFNTLKNEYPDFGLNLEVIHHTDFLNDLVNQGKLKLMKNTNEKVTYHDSCYLGRYNQIYESPRNILQTISNGNFVETQRNKDSGLCCGAGGAQMFLEETQGKRVNIERTEELLSTGSDKIVLNCPFCSIMISDGVKAKDSNAEVMDIAEIIYQNLDFSYHKKLEI